MDSLNKVQKQLLKKIGLRLFVTLHIEAAKIHLATGRKEKAEMCTEIAVLADLLDMADRVQLV